MTTTIAFFRLLLILSLLLYSFLLWQYIFRTDIYIDIEWHEDERNEILKLNQELRVTTFSQKVIPKKPKVTEPTVMDQRTMKLKELHDYIYATLDKLQNEGECDQNKLVRCHNSVMSGFGSSIHRHVICLHIAFALGRAFIIDHDYKNFNGLTSFTNLDSAKCGNFKEVIFNVKDNEKCDFKDPKCYKDEYSFEINNKYKLLEFTREADFPAPKYIPGTLPRGIENALIELNIKKPWHWFTSQLLGYMILRVNTVFKNEFSRIMDDMDLKHPLIGMHIRRGDKIGTESHYSDEKEFYNAADHWITNGTNTKIKEIMKTKGQRATIFVASGDRGAVRKIKRLAGDNFHVVGSPTNKVSNILRQREDHNKDTMMNILIDLHIFLHCDYAIVTYSSNVGRLLWELKTAMYPYNEDHGIISLDAKYMFYGWYDYTATQKYYLAKRSNNKTLTVGNYKLTESYEMRKLYHIHLPSRKTVSFKNGTKVDIAKIRIRHGRTGWNGYALSDDFVVWPGKPKYLIDI